LRRQLSTQECFRALEECGAPIVSIPGGEPLLHPQIDEIVAGLVARRKYVYLCTNAIKLEESLPKFRPSKYLTFSVHVDGPREEHDRAVCRDGVFDVAIAAIRAARAAGFRVTTNTTLFDGARPERVREMFDTLAVLGVEGMMLSPGYSYAKAPDQHHFLTRRQTERLFRRILDRPKRLWRFNQSPLFLEFLKGRYDLRCTPWGNPTYNVFGWQKPCYLLDEGYASSFAELMATTAWENYGRHSGNERCADCMVHSGYEPTAVNETFATLRGFLTTVRFVLFGHRPAPPEQIDEHPSRKPSLAENLLPIVSLSGRE
jgi:hopanoid biosynthesis associated radical SAM protein HpnH